MGGFKKFRKKAGRFAKKTRKIAKKSAKVVSKVSKVAGPILEEIGEATGQPELVALGKGAEKLSSVLDKGLAIDKKIAKAIKDKDPNALIDIVGDVAGDLGIANSSQVAQAKLRAKQIASIGQKASKGDIAGALQEGGTIIGREGVKRGLINKGQIRIGQKILKSVKPLGKIVAPDESEEIEKVRGKLLQLLMDINDDVVDNPVIQQPQQVIQQSVKPSMKMKKTQLVALAKQRGVPSSGTKAQILARLG